jgi:hypothetical protein
MCSVGNVEALWRFPVKSMRGERQESVDVTAGGVVGDRAYAVLDTTTGKVASAKHPKVWPDLFACRAEFVDEPRPGAQPPPALMTLGDGGTVRTDARDVDAVLSRFFGRDVALVSAAPEKFTIDEYHPDLENLTPTGARDVVVESPLGATLFDALGMPPLTQPGALFDLAPMSLLTTASLEHFRESRPSSAWDERRFRMNVTVATYGAAGLVENDWVGHAIAIGDVAQFQAVLPTPRCVMTSLAQDDLARDPMILKTIAVQNRRDIAGAGMYPCAGIYLTPLAPGLLRVGDEVRILEV